MKVIQDNRPISRFIYPFRAKCYACRAELEVEEGDVQVGVGEGQNGHKYDYHYVSCAVCTRKVLVTPPAAA